MNSISLWLTENENAGCLSINMQGLFHVSPGCLKITGLFLTWVRFQNCSVKQWETNNYCSHVFNLRKCSVVFKM